MPFGVQGNKMTWFRKVMVLTQSPDSPFPGRRRRLGVMCVLEDVWREKDQESGGLLMFQTQAGL